MNIHDGPQSQQKSGLQEHKNLNTEVEPTHRSNLMGADDSVGIKSAKKKIQIKPFDELDQEIGDA